MQAFLTQVQLPLLLTTLTLHVHQTHESPLSDNTSSSSCPRGWYQYDKFCVTQGEGSSEREIALYCDGFGGIGIQGICIIKRSTIEPSSSSELKLATSSEDDPQVSPHSDLGLQGSAPQLLRTGMLDNSVENDDEICPIGWAHYRNLCVYKPWSVTQTCHKINSIEFRGLCLKHAGRKAEDRVDLEDIYNKEKRICCCANFKARANNYGC